MSADWEPCSAVLQLSESVGLPCVLGKEHGGWHGGHLSRDVHSLGQQVEWPPGTQCDSYDPRTYLRCTHRMFQSHQSHQGMALDGRTFPMWAWGDDYKVTQPRSRAARKNRRAR